MLCFSGFELYSRWVPLTGCPTTSLSKLFSMQHRLPGWPQASAGLWQKTVTENFTADQSSNAMNYVKFTVVMAAAVALKQCLEYRVSSLKRLMYI